MKRYYIESSHTIYEDNFIEGEGEQVNSYSVNATLYATDPKDALRVYFDKTLFLSFDEENIDDSLEDGYFHYSNLVDNDNSEASESEIEKWKFDEIKLYSNNTCISIYELQKITKL